VEDGEPKERFHANVVRIYEDDQCTKSTLCDHGTNLRIFTQWAACSPTDVESDFIAKPLTGRSCRVEPVFEQSLPVCSRPADRGVLLGIVSN
jgi:hypothetical protein